LLKAEATASWTFSHASTTLASFRAPFGSRVEDIHPPVSGRNEADSVTWNLEDESFWCRPADLNAEGAFDLPAYMEPRSEGMLMMLIDFAIEWRELLGRYEVDVAGSDVGKIDEKGFLLEYLRYEWVCCIDNCEER
jgi:hypothetical protein